MAARDISTIQQEMIDDLVARAAAAGETITPSEWSAYDYRQLLTHASAVGCAGTEQQMDSFTADVEALTAAAAPQSGGWFQTQLFKFQYSATDPQVLELDDSEGADSTFAPTYPVPDATKQIIKYCSVVKGSQGATRIKVAAQVSGFPADIEATYPGSLAAVQSAVNLMAVDGMSYQVQSGNSDKLYLDLLIYYRGLYSTVIKPNVIAAINTYLAAIPFNGVVVMSDLEVAIKAVPGVTDVIFRNAQARTDGGSFGSGFNLYVGNTLIARQYATVAGYIVPETASGHTLNDLLINGSTLIAV